MCIFLCLDNRLINCIEPNKVFIAKSLSKNFNWILYILVRTTPLNRALGLKILVKSYVEGCWVRKSKVLRISSDHLVLFRDNCILLETLTLVKIWAFTSCKTLIKSLLSRTLLLYNALPRFIYSFNCVFLFESSKSLHSWRLLVYLACK